MRVESGAEQEMALGWEREAEMRYLKTSVYVRLLVASIASELLIRHRIIPHSPILQHRTPQLLKPDDNNEFSELNPLEWVLLALWATLARTRS